MMTFSRLSLTGAIMLALSAMHAAAQTPPATPPAPQSAPAAQTAPAPKASPAQKAPAPAQQAAPPATAAPAQKAAPPPAPQQAASPPAPNQNPPAQVAPAQAQPAPAAPADQQQPAAEPAEAPAAGPERSIERAKARIQELEARTDVAPAIRDQALNLLRTALGHLEAAAANTAAATRFQESAQRSPERVAEAKQQLEALQSEPSIEEFAKRAEKLPLTEAQQALDATSGEAATIKTDLDQLETRLRDMGTRSTAAREEQSAEKQALDALENPDAAQAGDQDPAIIDARRAALSAERRGRSSKLNLLEQELISLPARQASATARRDLAAAKLEKLTKRIPIIQARLNYLKEQETAKKQEEAAREARKLAAQHPVLEAYVKDTQVISDRQAETTRLIDEGKSKLSDVQSEIGRVRDAKASAQQVLEIGSIGGEFSELLRAMRAQLPSPSRLERRIWDRDQAIVDARLKRLQADEARRALSDTGGMAERVLASGVKPGDPPPPEDVKPALEKLVAARRDLYVQLHDSLVTRIAQLAELNGAERDLLNQTTQLRALLNSRLLWLPSAEPVGAGWFNQVRASFSWIADLDAWKATGLALLDRALERPALTALVLLIVGTLTVLWRRLFARLAAISSAVGRYSTDNYWRTPEALIISGLLAIKTPIIFGYAGWLLSQTPTASEFSAAVGAGLLSVASIVTFLRFMQYVCVEHGLFSVHFGWPERAREVLWRNIIWLKYAIIPFAFLLGAINVSSAQNLRDGLGRFAFLAGGVAVSIFLARILDPRRGIFSERLNPGHLLFVTRMIWYPLVVLVPLAIAGLALWGYYDGAAQIQDGLVLTIAIVVGAFLAYNVVMRQVLVTRRRLEIRRAYERREKARAQAAAQEASQVTGEVQPAVIEEPEVDIASISEQTRKLVRLAAFLLLAATLYFFWREALPSLALLDVPLWLQTVTIDGAPKTVPITVSNVMVALATAVITFIAARNLPGLLEITALHRLRVEAGTRYAVSAVSRYLIAIVGIIFAFRSIGFDWSQVQWIVAALGVGVGFGLQEIVANFISGLIILFERPVRVGDTVTIGNLTGTVSRIHIRATSMTDGENREIIIPNKSLITEKVINWTLTDSITRVTLKVAVRYGTDTLRAQMSILEAVKATPQVLDTPPPSVFFIGFGASALEFEVRAFVLQLAHRSTVINDLHVAIERALREQEITMS
ncbi:mechanosensitive ion channel domain-containing protein [Hyphomicrobium sp.]|uniref:mechanosensitive ion channel domain-containing protein n=1 Tax=Hyphomicrobium sp. TaxID=82 RepID=UPI002E2FCDFA|nr:mechanosensitive ion channel domain-containing protein [Hyphomicrobium sp.]HEX2839850.1 mechanosensitive ion channel domain-containing protein [Hyphomicrobium sp.]